LYNPDGSCYEGYFHKGEFHGEGKFTHADGSVEKGLWYNGTLQDDSDEIQTTE